MKLRSYIIPSPGNILIQCDLSQAESWIVAYAANEPNMIHSLNFSDIHTDTALFFDNAQGGKKKFKEISKDERYPAKKSNHAFAYRMSAPRFAQVFNKEALDLGKETISTAKATKMRNLWLQRYDLQSWWLSIEKELSDTRRIITPYGRVRDFFTSWGMELFKEATAHYPQSTVADHFKGAVQDELGIDGG